MIAGDRATVAENFFTSAPPVPEIVKGPPSRNGGGIVTPETFDRLGSLAKSKGFHQVVSSPLSRSSYHAEQAFEQAG